ncbi:MAG: 4-hydroxybutyryl-CoA dehydratase [Desulfobacteraceae bacterium]|nr:4-hydroxybutyryl-CoA dehydratase [Desulfobacteraceae bacterium]
MALMSGNDYKDSLKDLKVNAYAFGRKIDNIADHELTAPAIEAVALTYDLALDPSYRDRITLTSPQTGETINRLTHVYQSASDLISRFELMRDLTRRHGMCIGARCVSGNIMSALHTITYLMQQDKAVSYYDRFLSYLKKVQTEDLSVAGCITDAKGDRSKRVGEQPDPDAYLRIVEEKKDGIVVRGAKFQISGATIAHELLCIPTTALRERESAYAVSFSVPVDTPGLTYLHGAPAPDFRRLSTKNALDTGNPNYGIYNLSHIFFEDVFVPWERVFMCGETEYTHQLVSQTSPTFRCVTTSCKCGHRDLLLGGAAVASEYNGVGGARHITDKMVDMLFEGELAWGSIIAAATMGTVSPSGSFYPNALLANIAKRQGTVAIWNVARMAVDISGGLIMTAPTSGDIDHPELSPFIKKYMKANPEVDAEDRLKIMRLMEYLTGIGCILLAESTQGGAPAVVQQMIIKGELNKRLEEYKERVLDLADIRRKSPTDEDK